jgi:hypothetical protein
MARNRHILHMPMEWNDDLPTSMNSTQQNCIY